MSIAIPAAINSTLPFELPPPGQRNRYSAVTWDQYEELGQALLNRPVRVTYDHGEMEIAVTSHAHESAKKRIARLVEMLTFVLRIPIEYGGGMTFRREDLQRGFEPDECYWIGNEPQMRGRTDYNSTVDPPPDLAIEIEISKSLIGRLPIYAAFRIPEVWRCDGTRLRVMTLSAEGRYEESPTSLAFPFLPIDEFSKFLTPPANMNKTESMWQFHAWVEANAKNWARS